MAALPAAPAGDGKDVTSSVGNASAVMSLSCLDWNYNLVAPPVLRCSKHQLIVEDPQIPEL
jgi:hypothetical protein